MRQLLKNWHRQLLKSWRHYLLLLVPLLLAIPAVQPFLRNELLDGYDNVLHLWRSFEMDRMLAHGIPYTRWFPDMVYGLGYPLLLFNPPLTPLLAALAHRLGLDWPLAVNAVFAAGTILSGYTAWLWVRDLQRNAPSVEREVAALTAALVMVTLPFHAYVNYHRASMSEAFAWAFPPLILWGLDRWQRDGERRGLWAAVGGMTLLLLSHDATAYLVLPFLLVWGAVNALISSSWRSAGRGLLALCLGAGTAGFFWLPSILERGSVQFERVLSYRYSASFVSLPVLLEPPRAVDTNLINPVLPKGFGLLSVLCALPALCLLVRPGKQWRVDWRLAALWGLTLGYGWLATPFAAWFWKVVPQLAYLHFPWRFLSTAAVGAVALAGLGCGWVVHQWKPAGYVILTILSLGALGWLYPPTTDLPQPVTAGGLAAYEHQSGWLGSTTFGELLPQTVREIPMGSPLESAVQAGQQPARLHPEDLPTGARILEAEYAPNRASVVISSPQSFQATYWTFYYPGWRVWVDGELVPVTPSTPGGLMQFDIPAGKHTVKVRFGETPLRLFADAISLVSIAVCVFVLVRLPVTTRKQTPIIPSKAFVLGIFLLAVFLMTLKLLWIDPFDTPLQAAKFQAGQLRGVQHPYHVLYDGQFRLLGMDTLPAEIAADAPLDIQTYWTDTQPGGPDYGVGLVVKDAAGVSWNDLTPWPTTWYREAPATSTWPVETYATIAQRYYLYSGTPPGVYTLTLRVFDDASGFTYTGTDASSGQAVTELVLGQVQVHPPRHPQPVTTRYGASGTWGPLQLSGYDVDREGTAPGDTVLMTFAWQLTAPVQVDCTITTRLLDANGTAVAAYELPPVRQDFPLSMWNAGDVWRGRHLLRLPADLESDLYHWEVRACLELGTQPALVLGALTVSAPNRLWEVPELDRVTGTLLGGGVVLLGMQGDDTEVRPGDTLSLILVWQGRDLMETRYRVFLHLLSPEGQLVAQSDSEPAEWQRPTTGWLPGEVVLDPRKLQLPVDLVPGVYTLQVGMYTLEGGRLRTPDGADAVVLGKVKVEK